jgi:hypothetical protein
MEDQDDAATWSRSFPYRDVDDCRWACKRDGVCEVAGPVRGPRMPAKAVVSNGKMKQAGLNPKRPLLRPEGLWQLEEKDR